MIKEICLLESSHIEIKLSVNGYALFVSNFLKFEKKVFFGKRKSVFLFVRKMNLVSHLSLCLLVFWKH